MPNIIGFERFWSKAQRVGECLIWRHAKNTAGYGSFRVGSKLDGSRRKVMTHRFAYELTHGPIPPGMCVCHRCDVKLCIEPRHLFLGTHADNVADKMRKGRHPRSTTVPRKLSPEAAGAIKAMRGSGLSLATIGAQFGVSGGIVDAIFRGKTYQEVPCPT